MLSKLPAGLPLHGAEQTATEHASSAVILNPTEPRRDPLAQRLHFDRSALDLRRSFHLPVLTVGLSPRSEADYPIKVRL